MIPRCSHCVFVVAVFGCAACADQVVYRYEANVLPDDPSEAWVVADACDPPCTESITNQKLRLVWAQADNTVNYTKFIAQPPQQEPPTLWVEWRFRSNHPLGPIFFDCDAAFVTKYGGTFEVVNMYGDATFNQSGDFFVTGLSLNVFHTYRYESLDGINYRVAVDGRVFIVQTENNPNGFHYVQLIGRGGCNSDQFPNMVNEWDFVRYGTIASGEQVVGTDPPSGLLGPGAYTPFTTFRVTFNAPNYVYINDIAIEVTGGTAPIVTATQRTDTGGPETVEIVLDRALPANQRTRFTLSDASGTQTIDYDFRAVAPIPTTSTTSVIIMTLALLLSAAVILHRPRRRLA